MFHSILVLTGVQRKTVWLGELIVGVSHNVFPNSKIKTRLRATQKKWVRECLLRLSRSVGGAPASKMRGWRHCSTGDVIQGWRVVFGMRRKNRSAHEWSTPIDAGWPTRARNASHFSPTHAAGVWERWGGVLQGTHYSRLCRWAGQTHRVSITLSPELY
jgi:hypothetical protein